MAHQYAFEKLAVWQEAKSLTLAIYKFTNSFPEEEKFGLISQMRRCSISVCSNIAEGSSRSTAKDQSHFYTMAYSSLMELLNQSIISYELSFLPEDQNYKIRSDIEKISFKLNQLRKSTMKN